MKQKVIGAKEAGELLNIHPGSLIYWERKGWIKPAMKTLGGHRRYFLNDVKKIQEEQNK